MVKITTLGSECGARHGSNYRAVDGKVQGKKYAVPFSSLRFPRFRVAAAGMAASCAILLSAAISCGRNQDNAIPQNDQPSQSTINELIVELARDDLQIRGTAIKRVTHIGVAALPALQEATERSRPESTIQPTILVQKTKGVVDGIDNANSARAGKGASCEKASRIAARHSIRPPRGFFLRRKNAGRNLLESVCRFVGCGDRAVAMQTGEHGEEGPKGRGDGL